MMWTMLSEISAPTMDLLASEPCGRSLAIDLSREKPKALFILHAPSRDIIYGPEEQAYLAAHADFYAPSQTRESILDNPGLLADVEVIFSGWGAPIMDEGFLTAAPNLKAVFYGAGSIAYCVSEAFWDRGILITSAYGANAVPVAEYTLATILLSLKNFWRFGAQIKAGKGWGDHTRHVTGAFRTTVALVGCGMIARKIIDLLKAFDLRCIAHDPFLTAAEAASLGVERCTLEEAFALGDVVSLHAPNKPETQGMIAGRHFSLMKNGATFINTARAGIVNQNEMVAALVQRPDLTAILDVFEPEPVPVDSPLMRLGNVIMSPHIAGSLGPECQRCGRYMVEEFERYLAGEPLRYQITKELAARLA
jgi:phosphoglycerate dehydrogenase-like enzyme